MQREAPASVAQPDVIAATATAELLGISIHALRRLDNAGKLPSFRTPGGHRRFNRADIEALRRAS